MPEHMRHCPIKGRQQNWRPGSFHPGWEVVTSRRHLFARHHESEPAKCRSVSGKRADPFPAPDPRHLTAVTALVLVAWTLIACAGPAGGFEAVVLKVYDGDTVLIRGPGGEEVVRLVGIDAPERGKRPTERSQPFSRKARLYLSQQVKGQRVVVRSWGKDRYDRRLGELLVDGGNVNVEMVRSGMAEVYRGRTPEGFDISPYRDAQAEARDAALGVWSLGDAYMSPVDWKHRRR